MAELRNVEVVLALPAKQFLIAVRVPAGSSVADAIRHSGIAAHCADFDTTRGPVGIWGNVVERSSPIADGDRVELYRPLAMEPREARRRLAASGRTMRDG